MLAHLALRRAQGSRGRKTGITKGVGNTDHSRCGNNELPSGAGAWAVGRGEAGDNRKMKRFGESLSRQVKELTLGQCGVIPRFTLVAVQSMAQRGQHWVKRG